MFIYISISGFAIQIAALIELVTILRSIYMKYIAVAYITRNN